jgi:DNA-binding transcriptional regulator YdaS (Cro superfamily)
MKLNAYLKNKVQAEFAREIGVHPSLICLWLKKRRVITAEMAVRIELATDGKVTREELRPDLFVKAA